MPSPFARVPRVAQAPYRPAGCGLDGRTRPPPRLAVQKVEDVLRAGSMFLSRRWSIVGRNSIWICAGSIRRATYVDRRVLHAVLEPARGGGRRVRGLWALQQVHRGRSSAYGSTQSPPTCDARPKNFGCSPGSSWWGWSGTSTPRPRWIAWPRTAMAAMIARCWSRSSGELASSGTQHPTSVFHASLTTGRHMSFSPTRPSAGTSRPS